MGTDIRLALRGLAKAPAFTLVALVTLALGIGATTVVFSIVDSMLLRPRPFGGRSDRLVTLHSTHPTQAQDWDDSEISYPDLRDIRDQVAAFSAVEGFVSRNLSLAGDGESERVSGASVTTGLFRLLGVEARLGRTFREEDGARPGFESVVILSDAIWRRRFGSDPAIVGRAIPINGRALTVVGVMAPGFRFPEQQDVWLPFDQPRDEGRADRFLLGLALLRDGVFPAQAQAELDAMAGKLAEQFPDTNREWGIHLLRLRDFYVRPTTRRALAAMLGAVLFVLLVGAINVAGLLLARGIGRQRELTMRAALGAGRLRLVRLLLAESVALAALGGLVGLLLASWGIDALLASMAEPPPYWVKVAVDGRVLGFVTGLAALTAVACGLLPAFRTSRVDLVQGLGENGRAAGVSPGTLRLQGALVAGQVALSLALLVGATLLAGSAMRLQYADAGFDIGPLLSLRLYLAGDRYDPPAAKAQALDDISGRIAALPGVAAVALTGAIPADDGGLTVRAIPDRGVVVSGRETGVQVIPAMPPLWNALGVGLDAGRTFTDAEARDPDADVAVVNRSLARAFWPGDVAVGHRVGIVEAGTVRWLRVVGVAPDVVYEEFGEQTDQSRLNVYLPYARLGWRTMAVLVRVTGDPAAFIAPVRRAVYEIDPAIAPFDVLTMPARRAFTQWGERFVGRMFAGFALTALLMACLGAYGLMAYSTGQRTREVGVRLALGAKASDVTWLFLRRGVGLTLAGLAAGAPLAFATARAVEGLLFGVSPWAVLVWVAVPVALVLALLLASYVPARRASRADPAVALRQE